MQTMWMWWLLALGAVQGLELTEEQYYQLPQLFAMDDMGQCLSSAKGLYCLGTFALSADNPSQNQMLDVLQRYSDDPHHFNHTLLHRGYCLSSRCPAAALPAVNRFERCVSATASERYGLKARLVTLDHCTSAADARHTRPYDSAEIFFAVVIAVLLSCNAVGTLYDVFHNTDDKPNPYLMAWSVRASWRRLTANHEDGDPRLNALSPVQGIRAMTLMLVMMAHSVLGHVMSYIYNTGFVEHTHQHPLAMLIRNGTMVVQAYFVISSFLLTYNVLLTSEGPEQSRRPVGLRMLPSIILHRFIRIAPTHMLAVGMQATWYARVSSGPLWQPLVGAEAAICRKKWWTHLLFLNNLIYVDDMCILPSWFLAADMQLYIVCSALTLLLVQRPRWAPTVLFALLAAAIGGNFLAAYHFGLQPMVKVITPEMMRAQYVTHASFKWLYAAAWGSLPSSLIGIGLAFLYQHLRTINYPLHEKKVFCWIYRVFYVLLTCWMMSGMWWKTLEDPVAVAAYAALERPVYAFGMAVGMLGMFWGIGSVWRSACALSCWRALGRLSLGVLVAHWPHSQGQLAVRTAPLHTSVYLVGGHLFTTMFMTYWSALLIYLLVETPVQKFLEAFLRNKKK